MKKAYTYSPDTFEFIREIEATVDPETSRLTGRTCYALPENTTLVPLPTLKDNESAMFNILERKWEVKEIERRNEVLEDISTETAQQIQCKKNINKYKVMIKEIEQKYDTYMCTPVNYKGAKYLPRYVDDYAKLLLRPVDTFQIWDYEGVICKTFRKSELEDLCRVLGDLAETAYSTKKENIKICKVEIAKLEEKYNG